MRKLFRLLLVAIPLLLLGFAGDRYPDVGGSGARGATSPIANEAALQALYNLDQIQGSTGSTQRIYYFSSFSGDDTNPGTVDRPLRSFSKAKELCTTGARCSLFRDEVWSRYVLELDDCDSAFYRDEAVSWNDTAGGGAETGVIESFATAADGTCIAVITMDNPEVEGATPATAPVATNTLTATAGARTATIAAVADTLRGGDSSHLDSVIDPNCDGKDDLCIVFEAHGPADAEKPRINCGNDNPNPAASKSPIFAVDESTVATWQGWVVVQNIVVERCSVTAFATAAGTEPVALLTLNSEAREIKSRGSASTTPSAYKTENLGWIVALNSHAHSVIDNVGAQKAVDLQNQGGFVWIGRGSIETDATLTGGSGGTVRPLDLFGGDFFSLGASISSDLGPQLNQGVTFRGIASTITLVNTIFDSPTFIDSTILTGVQEVNFYGVTVPTSNLDCIGAPESAWGAGVGLRYFARGLVIDDCTTDVFFWANAANAAATEVDVAASAYDNSDGAPLCSKGVVDGSTPAECLEPGWVNFFDDAASINISSATPIWTGQPRHQIDPVNGAAVYGISVGTYTIQIPGSDEAGYVPTWVLNTSQNITGFVLDIKMGGR